MCGEGGSDWENVIRIKDCPGGDSDAGLEPDVPAHAGSLSVLSTRGMRSFGALGWLKGLEERSFG